MANTLEDYASAVSVDIGLNKISTTWTRIGNMQQSASIVLTILTFIITVIFGYIGSAKLEIFCTTEKYLLFYLVTFSFVFAIIAFTYLFRILMPKRTFDFVDSKKYYDAITSKTRMEIANDKELEDRHKEIINKITIEMIADIHKSTDGIISHNQYWYSYCINASIVSFISSLLFILFCLSKYAGLVYSDLSLFSVFIFSIIILFIFTIKLVVNQIQE